MNKEKQWWETLPMEPQRYRDSRPISMKKQKCMDTMAQVRALNEQTRVRRNEERGIVVLKGLVK
jgi:hypothetical protein